MTKQFSFRHSATALKSVFLAFIFTALMGNLGWGQTVTIGTGTSTSSFCPVRAAYDYTYSQQIQLASEITAGGIVSGQNITAISFYWNGSGTLVNSGTWVVYLGNTTQTNFSSTSNWVSSTSLTQVYNGAVSLPGVAGWMTITLSTPFTWTGSNLVIAIDENVSSSAASGASWRYTSTSSNYRELYYYSYSTNPDPASPPSGTLNYNRPNVNSFLRLCLLVTHPQHSLHHR